MQYSELIAGLQRGQAGRIEAAIPDDWMQGRTTYGGLTAALCLEAALELVPDMPVRADMFGGLTASWVSPVTLPSGMVV